MRSLLALLLWIGVVAFAMLSLMGAFVAAGSLMVGGPLLALTLPMTWLCWVLARKLSAAAAASLPAAPNQRAQHRRADDDEDEDVGNNTGGGLASALIGSGYRTASSPNAVPLTGSATEPVAESLACQAGEPDPEAGDRDEACSQSDSDSDSSSDSDSDSSSDSGSDNSASD